MHIASIAIDLGKTTFHLVALDEHGKIVGKKKFSRKQLRILFGSHIDSVPSGGNFDGDLGSMSAIAVIHTLQEHDATTRHPLQMVIWPNEEGGFTGSGGATGVLEFRVFQKPRSKRRR